MRLVRQSNGLRVSLDPQAPLGVGGEARVFALPLESDLCAKIYHQPSDAQARKLAAMLVNPPDDPMAAQGHVSIAWPVDLLHTLYDGQQFVGFLMPRVSGMRSLFNVYNPVTRRKETPLFNYQYLYRAAQNVARGVQALHGRGYVIGDINESNFLVTDTALVTLVDTDSFQVRDPLRDLVYRCPVGKPEFTPPELQDRNFRLVDRMPEHDLFGLAVLIFQLLMEGAHPYSGIYEGGGDPPPYEERIRTGHFTYGNRPTPYRPMPLAPPISLLPSDLYALFLRAFEAGHVDPPSRPAPAEWIKALGEAEGALVTCGVNAQHRYGAHLDRCPWCQRTELLGGRDPFPLQPQEPIKRPPRPQLDVPIAAGTASAPRIPAAPSPSGTPGPLPSASAGLPQWPLAPTALPPLAVGAGAPRAAFPAMPPYHPATWIAGSMAILALSLPGFQFLTGLIALVSGVVGWRVSGAGRSLSALFAAIGALVIGFLLVSAAGKALVKAPVRTVIENGAINSVAFSADGDTVATATGRNEDQRLIPGQITLYNAVTGNLMHALIDTGDMTSVAFSPDGKTLATGSGALLEQGSVKLYDADTITPRAELTGFHGDVSAIAFSRDGNVVVTGSRDHTIIVWDARTGGLLRLINASDEIFSVAVSPDGRWIASAGGSSGSGLPGQVAVWDLVSGVLRWSQRAHSERALSVAFAPDGALLASAGNDDTLRLWNPQTGRLQRTFEARGVPALCALAFSPDGRQLVTGGSDGITRLWDLSRGSVMRQFKPADEDQSGQDLLIQAVAFAPNGRFLASGAQSGALHIWRLR